MSVEVSTITNSLNLCFFIACSVLLVLFSVIVLLVLFSVLFSVFSLASTENNTTNTDNAIQNTNSYLYIREGFSQTDTDRTEN